jgi:UDP-N-acetylglucosamine:LPS N-acetylglucosamine transferase
MVLQKELNAEGLADALTRYMDNRPALQEMGERARQLSRPDAAETIVDRLMEMAA